MRVAPTISDLIRLSVSTRRRDSCVDQYGAGCIKGFRQNDVVALLEAVNDAIFKVWHKDMQFSIKGMQRLEWQKFGKTYFRVAVGDDVNMTSKLDIRASTDIPRGKYRDDLMSQILRFCKNRRQEFGEALPICEQVRSVLQEEVIEDVRPASLREVHLVPEEEARCGFDAADFVQWPASVVYVATQIQDSYFTATWRQRFWKSARATPGDSLLVAYTNGEVSESKVVQGVQILRYFVHNTDDKSANTLDIQVQHAGD